MKRVILIVTVAALVSCKKDAVKQPVIDKSNPVIVQVDIETDNGQIISSDVIHK